MMRRAALAALLVVSVADGAPAQDLPPDLRAAYWLGHAAHMLSVASPCFPRQGGDADLWHMLYAAQARIRGNPAQEEAFHRGRTLASQQQRRIERSDPAACSEVRATLQHITQGG